MKDIKLALVGYLNTKPFEYGLKTSENRDIYSIYFDTPANCVNLYENEKVDIALVPAGALPTIGDYRLITNTCIGCDDDVRTVVLMSYQPIGECNHVILDSHSRTSALLTQILLQKYWGVTATYSTQKVEDIDSLKPNQAVLMIGDKVFQNENKYKHTYDLGHYWKLMTGLPFAYAVWIAKDHVTQEQVDQLSKDLSIGVSRIDKVIEEQEQLESTQDLASYYRNNIDYLLDADKNKALKLFLSEIAELKSTNLV